MNEPTFQAWRKRLLNLLLSAMTLIALILGTIYLMQDNLLYFPEPIDPRAALAQAGRLRLAPWPDAQAPRAWLRETPATTRGTIILFHGNAGHALHRSWYADELEKLGFKTLLAEYPGYGHRNGAMGEKSLAGDAAESIALLRQQLAGPLYVAGESLGAGVAAAALARNSAGIDGVMLITPWNDLTSVAKHHYPILPVRLLLRDRYDSVANLRGFAGPKLVLVAEQDSIVPAKFGRALYESLGSNKKLLEIPNTDHNDWMRDMRSENWREVFAFLEGKSR